MASIRTWHTYLGILIAPSVLFFALTGALQIFSLHEAHGTYHPLPIVEKFSSVHKDQVFALGEHHEEPPSQPAVGAQAGSDAHPPAPAEHENEPAIGRCFYYHCCVHESRQRHSPPGHAGHGLRVACRG